MEEADRPHVVFCCWLARQWSALVSPVAVPEEAAGWVRAQQIAAFKRLGPWVVAANLANASLLTWTLHMTPRAWMVMAWGALVAVLMAVLTVRLVASRRHKHQESHSMRAIHHSTRDSALLGAIWGALPVIVFPSVSSEGHELISVVVVGMMCGGAFMLSTLPQAALAYLAAIGAGAGVALLGQPEPLHLFLFALLGIYTAVLVSGVRWSFREFVGRLLGERLAREQAEVIGLLLRDFEMASSDWLWSTDREGCLTSGAERFGFAAPAVSRAGPCGFAGLFEAGDGRAELIQRMARHESFAELVVETVIGGERRWIALTGKPLLAFGAFRGYHGVASDITAERLAAARVSHMAAHDALTGLANRASLNTALKAAIAFPDERKQESALLLVDLDRFKVINDALGHGTGDALLTEVGRRMRRTVGNAGQCFRLGGDEFAVLLTTMGIDADYLARRIVSEIARPSTIGGMRADCSASIGMRRFTLDDFDCDAVLRHADLALFDAKGRGTGHVVEFDWSMDVDAQERVLLERELKTALAEGQLRLDFQPLFEAASGTIAGVEALVRWQHPERGEIPPGRFIDIAERSGLIVQVGEWVIRAAVEAAARLSPSIRVAINVSPIQLRSTNLPAIFLHALAATGVDPRRIDVEITESVMLSDSEANMAVLQRLRCLGLGVCLDDFGSGYSSFGYLKQFQFTKLNIDKSFTDAVDEGGSACEIIRAIVSLARALGMRTVVEGIETESQMEAVRALGCDEAQGFLLARPQRLAELLRREGVAAPPAEAAETAPAAEGASQAQAPRQLRA